MWVKMVSGDYINLDKVNTVIINPYNAIVCKFDDSTMVLGNFTDREKAETVLKSMFENVNCTEVQHE